MAGNDTSTFKGFLKTRYAKNLINTIPLNFVAQRDWMFKPSKRIGKEYHQAVRVKYENGATYSRAGQGAFTLNVAQSGLIEEAKVDAFQFMLKSQIDYETLHRATEKGELAYGSAGDELLRNMSQSSRKREEIDLWHGQSLDGIGVVESVDGGNNAFVIKSEHWVPGVWIGAEGAVINAFFQNATPLDSMRSGDMVVQSVDPLTRTITVDSLAGSLAQNDVILFKSQRTVSGSPAWNSMAGALAIAGTSGGNLFGLSTSYSIWKPNQYNVGGILSFEKVQEALTLPIAKGLHGECTLYVSIYAWNDLMTEQAALRRFGGKFSGKVQFDNGANELKFYYQLGVLRIKPTIYLPVSKALLVPSSDEYNLCRVGTTDVTFKLPIVGETVTVSETSAGITILSYWCQSLFTPVPGKLCLLYGITSDSAP